MSSEDKLVTPGLWAPRKDLPETKRRLRAKVPKPRDYEIKAGCFYEGILNHLYHNGFDKSAELVEELINKEIENIESINIPPYLTSSKEGIIQLAEILKDIEMGKSTPMALIKLAVELSNSKYQRWIAFRLFEYSLKLASAIRSDRGYLESEVRYVYGKFLLDAGKLEEAAEILEVAAELAGDKSWITLSDGRPLYEDVNYLQFLINIKSAEDIRKENLKEAIELSKQAVKHSFDADMKSAPPRALLLRGRLEIENGEYLAALGFLNQTVRYAQVANMQDLICEANLLKALALYRLGQTNRALAFIRLAKGRAIEKRLPLYVGKSFMMLGQLNVTRKRFEMAGVSYMEALEEFVTIGDREWITHAKCKAGHALACATMEVYYQLIIRSTKEDSDTSIKRLMLWKDKRVPFWNDIDHKYSLIEREVGFYDEYETEKLTLIEGQVVFDSQVHMKVQPWRKPVHSPFSKKFIRHFGFVCRRIFLAL